MSNKLAEVLAGRGTENLRYVSRRWILIGRVRTPWFVVALNWGVPGGYYLNWRGRVNPFQPHEFLSWNGLEQAIDYRLGMAGLARVGDVKRRKLECGREDVWVEVRRTMQS